MTQPVILNSTPLIALWSIDKLTLLNALYGVVYIPPAVHAEFLATETTARKNALDNAKWIEVKPLENPQQAMVYIGLDVGEAEVLALAMEHPTRLVIIDERRGRRYAQRLGLPLTGTLGVLLTAKYYGLIPAIAPLIEELLANGLYINAELKHKTLELADELL